MTYTYNRSFVALKKNDFLMGKCLWYSKWKMQVEDQYIQHDWVLEDNNKEYVEDSVLIFYYFRVIKVIYIFEVVKNKATDETIAVVWSVSSILLF